MTRDGDGMSVEVVKGDTLGKETVERYTDVRSVELPSTRGMVRLDDVVELLNEDDDVPPYAVERVTREIDDDPSTGGHITINSPSSSSHTALFERVEIYAAKVDNARGTPTCGPDETWLHVVIPDELDERMFDAVNFGPLPDDVYNRSTLVERAVEELLDDTDRVDDAPDSALVDELQSRGYHVSPTAPESYDDVIDELREFFAQGTTPEWLEDLTGPVDAFELAHVEALEEHTDIPGDEKPGADVAALRYHVCEAKNDGFVRRAFEQYHRLPVEDGGDGGD